MSQNSLCYHSHTFTRFFVALVVYFIAGILVMKFHKGATGKELIPNYAFWSELPLLVKVKNNMYRVVIITSLNIGWLFICYFSLPQKKRLSSILKQS